MDERATRSLLGAQSGVIGRRQMLQLGGRPHDLERWLRRHQLTRVLPGVFASHSGELSWTERAWVGLVYLSPAVLAGDSALRATAGRAWLRAADDGPIAVAVDRERHVAAPPGYRLARPIHLPRSAQWHLSPPRLRVEDAALDLAAGAASDHEAFAVLAEVVRLRLTTPPRLVSALGARKRVRRRGVLEGAVADLAAGTHSVLEREYRRLVAEPHLLPAGRRQHLVVVEGRRRWRDVALPDLRVVIELDGRLGHDSPDARDRDLQRDLDAAVAGELTIRLGWGQVVGRPCETARRLADLLVSRRWPGRARACGPTCALSRAA